MNEIESKLEVTGVKHYKDSNYKDTPVKKTPVLTVQEVIKKEEVMVGNTLIKPIKMEYLSKDCRKLIKEKGKGWITRNSVCPCGSGKRFKSCCMELVDKK